MTPRRSLQGFGRAAAQAGLAVVILLSLIALRSTVIENQHHVLYDFRGGLYNAGLAIQRGRSPYAPGFLAHQAALLRAGHRAVGESASLPFSIPVYPALANLLVVPLSLLPFAVAGAIWTLAGVLAMAGGLWLLGVRDWRCQLLALLSWPFLFGAFLGAIGPLLVLGAGVAWRWRERIWPPAVSIAALVAVKVFPWTLAVWLLITGRRRALAASVGAGIALTFGAWAVIGFHGLVQYPQMLSNLSFLQENRANSVVGVLVLAGVSSSVASGLALVLAGAILLLAWRQRGGADGDRRVFGLVVLAALTGTPIVWEHYMVLLFVPVALLSPRFSRLWLIPLLPPVAHAVLDAIFPGGQSLAAFSPQILRVTVPWLLAELALGVALSTTPAQRRVLWARVRGPLRPALPTAARS